MLHNVYGFLIGNLKLKDAKKEGIWVFKFSFLKFQLVRDALMTDVKTTAYKRKMKGAESGVYDHHAKEDKSICTLDKA